MLYIGNRIQVSGGLFAAEAAVEVTADRSMPTISRELANVINVIRDLCERDAFIVLRTACPAGAEHPVVEGNTNHAIPRDDRMDLFIVKLALMRNKRATIVMACKHGTFETVHGFPECLIRKMREVKQDSKPVHFPEQLLPLES